MSEITITDETGTSGTVTTDRDDAAETIRNWFPHAPDEVASALDTLQQHLNRGEYTGETEAYLGIRIS